VRPGWSFGQLIFLVLAIFARSSFMGWTFSCTGKENMMLMFF